MSSQLLLLAAAIVIPVLAMLAMLWSLAPDARSAARSWAISMALLAIGAVVLMLHTVSGRLLGRIAQLSSAIREAAQGNLAAEMHFSGSDEVARIGQQVDRLAASLSITVSNVRNSAAVVAQTGHDLSQASNELSERTSQQAAALAETTASIRKITATVDQNAQGAAQLDRLASEVRTDVESGERAMHVAVETIHGIQVSSNRMSEIVAVIDSIAFQTNILALNAAVEAARAGEQGKSFAVVAAEVSTLAQRAATAAREIKMLINASSDQIGAGVTHVHAMAESLRSILAGVQQVATQVGEISAATGEQSRGLGQIAHAIGELDAITQHNTQLVEQSAGAAAELSERAARIAKWVGRFRLRQGSAEEAMALVHRVLDHAKKHGVPSAIAAVNDPKMRFFDRDMYVFIGAADSTCLASAGRPERVGARMVDSPGIDGRKIHAMTLARVNSGGGWIEYEAKNPVTGVLEPKMSYIMRLGHDMSIGCGVYRTEQMSIGP